MKELTEQEKQELKEKFEFLIEHTDRMGKDVFSDYITLKQARYLLSLLSKDQPVVGADDEHLFYVEYWAGRLLGNEQDWEIAKEIIDSQKLYASAVASKMARENEELKKHLENRDIDFEALNQRLDWKNEKIAMLEEELKNKPK